MTPDLTASARSVANLGRLAVISACLGGAGVAVLTPFGYLWMALFGCLGLALGLLNTALVRRSAAQFAASADPSSKRRFAVGVLGRLAMVTAFAVGLTLLVRPDGLGVFAGLAAFQLLMIASASVPLFKELRQSGAQA